MRSRMMVLSIREKRHPFVPGRLVVRPIPPLDGVPLNPADWNGVPAHAGRVKANRFATALSPLEVAHFGAPLEDRRLSVSARGHAPGMAAGSIRSSA